MAEDIGVTTEFVITEVDLKDDLTIVYEGPCILRGGWVNEAMDAQDAIIEDSGSNQKKVIPASSPLGFEYTCYDGYLNGLVVNPDNAATQGFITVVWKPFTVAYEPGSGISV